MKTSGTHVQRSVLAFLALLAWIGVADAGDFDARRNEAIAELDSKNLVADEHAALKSALTAYFDKRENCLQSLLQLLRVETSDKTALFVAVQAVVCRSHSSVIADAVRALKDPPSVELLAFANTFLNDESRFLASLPALTVGEQRDRLVELRLRLTEMTSILDEKWEEFLEYDEDADERARAISTDLRKIQREQLAEAAGLGKAANASLEAFAQYCESDTTPAPKTGSPQWDAAIELFKSVLGPVIRSIQGLNERWAKRFIEYSSAFATKRRIAVLFVGTREGVEEFVEENGMDEATAAQVTATSSIGSFVASAGAGGQRTDAEKLRDKMLEVVMREMEDVTVVFHDFVKKHELRFFGALGPSIKERLVDGEAWQEYAKSVEDIGLPAALRLWNRKATEGSRLFEIDLRCFTADDHVRLKAAVRSTVDDLVTELKRASEQEAKELQLIKDETEDLADELD